MVGQAATITLLAVAWFLGARWGWETTVPALHLPHLRAVDYFDATTLRRTHEYSRVVELLWVGSTLAGLLVVAAIAASAHARPADRHRARRYGHRGAGRADRDCLGVRRASLPPGLDLVGPAPRGSSGPATARPSWRRGEG